ncbi:MAG TPA: hypothetical protein VLZ78_09675, partial [Terrimesophilobacter sp.]|nr:hypothetical protein [Terrimesophilobacter sp.]
DLFPFSLPVGHPHTRSAQTLTEQSLIEVRDDLRWNPDTLRGYPWLVDLADVPADASPPLAMSPPPADAVCSYGWSGCEHLPKGEPGAVEWIEAQRIRGVSALRWWQRLSIVRQLEHRADGSLCAEKIVSSGPRRIGKSVRIRGLAAWRMALGPRLFGEAQTIVHTGSDVAICRQIQKGAWAWATARWGKDAVSRANGKEAVTDGTDDGSEWLVKAQDAVYGYDVCYGIADECWDVKPDTISEGLEPASMERSSPQIDLTSTAHRRATSLMRTELRDALAVENPRVLILLWAAPPGSDPGDPAAWRAASPHWSEARHRMIADKYEKALAGEADPEFDDPDPMAGFTAQYLNGWPLRTTRSQRGEAMVTEEEWAGLTAPCPTSPPRAVAVEGWPGQGVSVAQAWRVGARSVVAVTDHPDLAAALAAVRAAKFRGTVTLGASLAADPAVKRIRYRARTGRTGAAVAELTRLIGEDAVRHDGAEHLAGQVLGVRTLPGADGLRMASAGRADAVKAAAWAIEGSRTAARSSRPARIQVASSA